MARTSTRLTRLVLLALLPAIAATALAARVYVHFDRVRLIVIKERHPAQGGVLSVGLPEVPRLVGVPSSLVLRLQNEGSASSSIVVRVNGVQAHEGVLDAGRAARWDVRLARGFERPVGNVVEVRSADGAWSLDLLEAGNAFGFSHGLFSFVITPAGTSRHVARPPWWQAVAVLGGLLLLAAAWRPIRATWLRVLHRALAAVAGPFLVAALVLPFVSPYEALLSRQAFWMCVVALYVPALVDPVMWSWRLLVNGSADAWRFAAPRRGAIPYVATVVVFLVAIGRFYDPVNGFTSLIHFGAESEATELPALRAQPHAFDGPYGYDGQFYAQLALDPLARDPAIEGALDTFAYRARRVLFAATAHVLGLGQPRWILQAYALQNVACWFAVAWLLLGWLPAGATRRFAVWFLCLWSYGLIASVEGAMLEGPSLLLLLLAVRALERGRHWVTAGVLALAVLGRETNVLGATALLDRRPESWRALRELMLQAAVIAGPLALWLVYLLVTHFELFVHGAGGANFAPPLSGYAGAVSAAVSTLQAEGWRSWAAFELLALVSLAVQAASYAVRPQWKSAWYRIGLVYVVLMLVLGPGVWESSRAFARVLLPMAVAYNLLLPRGRAFWPMAIAGNLPVIHSLEALGLLGWPGI